MKTIFFLLMSLSTLAVSAQVTAEVGDFKVTLLTKDKWGMLSFTGKSHSFTVELTGNTITQTTDAQPNYLLVDNALLLVSCVPMPDGADASGYSADQQKTVLSAYADYEMNYFKDELHLVTRNLQKEWLVLQGRTFLLWQFDVPQQAVASVNQGGRQAVHQLYLSTVWYDQVLDMNCPLMNDSEQTAAQTLLYKTAKSFKSY
jgi:hypothetical protein